MNKIRLLPVVVMAIAALLVLKTIGLVTNGGYALTGVSIARASGGEAPAEGGTVTEADHTLTLPDQPTLEDTSPVIADTAPTISEDGGGHGASGGESDGGHGEPAAEGHGEEASADAHGETASPADHAPAGPQPTTVIDGKYCRDADATLVDGEPLPESNGADHGEAAPAGGGHGEEEGGEDEAHAEPDPASFANSMVVDCLPTGDAVPLQIKADGSVMPLVNTDGSSPTEQQLLERLASRRGELEKYEQDLALRASLVDAAEKRIAERQATLESLESQIAGLVDQREQMESGQFAGIVAMYSAMKPKDAATIFNSLDIEVLLRVAKAMEPRKMAPILAAMDPGRAQELTVKMAALADTPVDQMSPDDLAALPQINGQ